jgi:hypothetical protein
MDVCFLRGERDWPELQKATGQLEGNVLGGMRRAIIGIAGHEVYCEAMSCRR